MNKGIVLFILLFLLSTPVFSATYTVTNLIDAGAGSLRQAITDANANSGTDTIAFNIPLALATTEGDTTWWRILVGNNLPTITESVSLDGTSQTTNKGDTNPYGPEIELDGTAVGVGTHALTITANNCTILNLVINRFDESGIRITGDNNKVYGCYIGTDVSGESVTGMGNGDNGIRIQTGSNNNQIGNGTAAGRNIISGNLGGILIYGVIGSDTTSNEVLGNYIGTDKSGTIDLGNTLSGVAIQTSDYNKIGDGTPDGRNIISGNNANGIWIADADYNEILDNYIGTNVNGTADLGNSGQGIHLTNSSTYNKIGDGTPDGRNIISGNNASGIWFTNANTNSNEVTGNYIGTDVTGTQDLENAYRGIALDGGQYNIIGPSNIIAFNGSTTTPSTWYHGINVGGATTLYNRITQNSFFSNYTNGIVLANGGNSSIASPEIDSTITFYPYTGSLEVSGTNASANGIVEIFRADGNQGKTYLGSITADSTGSWSGQVNGLLGTGNTITATTTDTNMNTSEFSQTKEVSTNYQPVGPRATQIYRFGPNPFNPNNGSARIWYWLTEEKNITIFIIDLTGTIVWKQTYLAGNDGGRIGANSIEFNGKSAWGETLANGTYLYKILDGRTPIGGGKIALIK